MSIRSFTKKLQTERNTSQRSNARDLIDSLRIKATPMQLALLNDRSRDIAVRGSRRVGKTFGIALKLYETALEKPGSKSYYLALTKGQCRENVWPYLKKFAAEHEIDMKALETFMTVTLPNGSQIRCSGAETADEIEKLRGGADGIDLVIIDECKSFMSKVLTTLIDEILHPALANTLGTLIMIGTPGNIFDVKNPFFAATRNEEDLRDTTYSTHVWHVKNNSAKPWIWEEMYRRQAAKVDKGISTWDDPGWLREGMGQWAFDDSLQVYRVRDHNLYDGTLPSGHEWHYLLGMDLGFRDATAFIVFAYSDHADKLYMVDEVKKSSLTYNGIKKELDLLIAKYGDFEATVVDGGNLGLTIVETLCEDGYNAEPAKKTDKLDYITLFNSELAAGTIMLLEGSALESEMWNLQFTQNDRGKLSEDPSCDNHCCDAALYIHRWAHHHLWTEAEKVPDMYSEEWYAEQEEIAVEMALREMNRSGLDEVDDNLTLDQDFTSWTWKY